MILFLNKSLISVFWVASRQHIVILKGRSKEIQKVCSGAALLLLFTFLKNCGIN